MNDFSSPARRALDLLTDARTLRAGAAFFYPTVMSFAVGLIGTILDLGLTALIARPWRVETFTLAVGMLLVFVVLVFPVLYFVFGARYGLARAAFRIYETTRPVVIDLVLEHATLKTDLTQELQKRRVPRAVRWLVKIIMTVAGAGDRLTDAIAEIDEHDRPAQVVMGAFLDDLFIERLVEPARNAIIIVAVANAIVIAALTAVAAR